MFAELVVVLFLITALVSALDGWNDRVQCNTDLSQGGTGRTGKVQAYTIAHIHSLTTKRVAK